MDNKGIMHIYYNDYWMTLEQTSFNQYKLDGKRIMGGSIINAVKERAEELDKDFAEAYAEIRTREVLE